MTREKKLSPLNNQNLLKSLNQSLHVDVILLLIAHHLEELIKLYRVVQLVFNHRPYHLQQDFLFEKNKLLIAKLSQETFVLFEHQFLKEAFDYLRVFAQELS